MGHMIQGFIGYPATIKEAITPFMPVMASIAELPQRLCCLFLCEKVNDSIHTYINTDNSYKIEPFDFFDSSIKKYFEMIRPKGTIIYIETDYFGGEGTQFSGIILDGKLLATYQNTDTDIAIPYPDRLLESPINKALRQLGVIRDAGLDEFDTLGLGNYRHMPYNDI